MHLVRYSLSLAHARTLAYALLLLFVLLPELVSAQTSDNILDNVENVFQAQTGVWQPRLLDVARKLFFGLVVIEWILTFGFIALNGGGLNDIAAATLRSILFIGFGIILLNNPNWVGDITRGFMDSGKIAVSGSSGGTAGVNPSNIFDMGLDTAKIIFSKMSRWSPVDSIAYALTGLFIVIIFAVIAAIALVAFIEMYIILSAGVVMLGFMATRFTKDIGLKYINYAVSLGVKLFMIQMIAGLTVGVVTNYIDAVVVDGGLGIASALTLVAIGVVSVYLIQQIPNYAQSLVSGLSMGSLPDVQSTVGNTVKTAIRAAAAVKTGGASELAGAATGATGGKSGGGLASAASTKGAPKQQGGGSSSNTPPSKSGSSSGGSGGGRMSAIASSAKSGSATSSSSSSGGYSSGSSTATSSGHSGWTSTSTGTAAFASGGSSSSSSTKAQGAAGKTESSSAGSHSDSGSTPHGSAGSVVSMNPDSGSAPAKSDTGSSAGNASASGGALASGAAASGTGVSQSSAPSPQDAPSADAGSSANAGGSQPSTAMKDQSSDDIARMKNQAHKSKVTSIQRKINELKTKPTKPKD